MAGQRARAPLPQRHRARRELAMRQSLVYWEVAENQTRQRQRHGRLSLYGSWLRPRTAVAKIRGNICVSSLATALPIFGRRGAAAVLPRYSRCCLLSRRHPPPLPPRPVDRPTAEKTERERKEER
uniref:Uncharacterized protein n=1 Tax=Oryza sativa subsp. japonica TaxID=39947 RepID=Q6ZAY6_ORYSJ|nr:hypothetical protein [Oryza sativa Japonica Group]